MRWFLQYCYSLINYRSNPYIWIIKNLYTRSQDGAHKIKKFSSGIRYVDIGDLRYIEQNARKNSQWGKKAREGHKIMWIIKGRTYLVRIFDGEFTEL